MIRFSRLERAVLQLETGKSFETANEARELLREIRTLLGGPVP